MPNPLFPQHTYLLNNYTDNVKLIISINQPYDNDLLTSLVVQLDGNQTEINRTNEDGSPFTYDVENIPNGDAPPTQPKDTIRMVTSVPVPPGIAIPIKIKYQLKQGDFVEDYESEPYTPAPGTLVTFQAELDFS